MTRLMMVLVLFLFGTGLVPAQSFTTNFNGTENPLSESGAWSHAGLVWTHAQKVNGVAYGTQTGGGGYDDSYAHLSGFPPDQSGSGVIQRIPGGNGIHEVEILLRWKDTDHSATGYECLLSYDGSYAEIVKWNGPLGDFTYISSAENPPFPQTGDTFSASITGNLIIAYYNGVEIMRATDSSFTTGNPGVGFYIRATNSTGDMGFTSFSASGAGATAVDDQDPAGTFRPLLLAQNQPNPFNGGTTLEYRLASPGFVTLKVYDLLGSEVATLVEGIQPAGRHTSWFGGASLESGVYLARLMSGGVAETRKMLLLK
jgi:hypothetical protein